MPIVICPQPQRDHARRNVGKNITPQSVGLAHRVTQRDAAIWSLSGVKRTSRGDHKLVVRDPKRHFETVNCRIAKGSFDHLVGDPA
jgi:hypothetical protein